MLEGDSNDASDTGKAVAGVPVCGTGDAHGDRHHGAADRRMYWSNILGDITYE